MRKLYSRILLSIGLMAVLATVGCLAPDTSTPERVPVAPSSMFFEKSHHFCSDQVQDRFLVGYFGDALLDTDIYFYVISHKGDTLYQDHWPAQAHLETLGENTADDAAKADFIQKSMRALVDGDQLPAEVSVSDSLARAMELGPPFHYQVGSERNRTIAFSKSGKNVVVL